MALYQSVEQGRRAARLPRDSSDEAPSEEAALRRYRQAVGPVWRHRDSVARQCRSDPELSRALDAIERLRYSEEHNVRSQAAELGPLRRRVRHIVTQRLTSAPSR